MWICLPTKQIALMGLMLGMIIVLAAVESMFMPLPFMPPHVKPGFANIVVMYCVFAVGRTQAITLNVAKSMFVFFTRGAIAGLLSLCGGMLSIAVIILLSSLKKKQASYVAVSVSGACAHNFGQFVVVMLLMSTAALVYYLPILVISGVATGLLTGILLKILMPIVKGISTKLMKS